MALRLAVFFCIPRGFVDGSRRGFSPLVKVAPARDVRAIKLTLTPQAIMSGRVTDSDSEPFQGVQLGAIRRQYMQGNLLAVPAGTATTNDLGEYRISDLAPGRYLLIAIDRQAEHSNLGLGRKVSKDPAQETYLPMSYPGVAESTSAIEIEVTGGAVRQGIDIALRKSIARRVRGHITKGGGPPPSRIYLNLAPFGGDGPISMRNSGQVLASRTGPSNSTQSCPAATICKARRAMASFRFPSKSTTTTFEDLRAAYQTFLTMAGRIHWNGDPPVEPVKPKVYLTPVQRWASARKPTPPKPSPSAAFRRKRCESCFWG